MFNAFLKSIKKKFNQSNFAYVIFISQKNMYWIFSIFLQKNSIQKFLLDFLLEKQKTSKISFHFGLNFPKLIFYQKFNFLILKFFRQICPKIANLPKLFSIFPKNCFVLYNAYRLFD